MSPSTPAPAAVHTARDVRSADDEAFAQDLISILGSHRPDPSDPPPPQPMAQAASTQAAEVPASTSTARSHEVFDRLGEHLAFANAYDLGRMPLTEAFDRFDRVIDAEAFAMERAHVARSAAAALDRHDDRIEIAEIARRAAEPVSASPVLTAPAPAAEAAPAVRRITNQTDLVPQIPGLTCLAAAAASVLAWRDGVRSTAEDVVAGVGLWEPYASARSAQEMADLEPFGFTFEAFDRTNPARLWSLLETHGPLLFAAPGNPHAVVVSGMTGDGTAVGTTVEVVDPWADGMTVYAAPNPGSRATLPFANLLARLGAATGSSGAPIVAYLRPRP